MKFTHSEEIVEKFKDNFTVVVSKVSISDKEVLKAKTAILLSSIDAGADYTSQSIELWKNIFSKMGAKPKYLSSLAALNKYYSGNKRLYEISPVVDFYNAYSLANGIPMAVYDEDKFQGNISLRTAQKGELFTPLGNPSQSEKTKNNEVAYADDARIICRYWNLQDCHETRVTDDTTKYLFFFDVVNTELVTAPDKFKQISDDFKEFFGDDIFCGMTGPGLSNVLDW